MDSRRILITGLSSRWGGRLAQVLEREPSVDAIVGVDSSDPQHELERTEFVRVDMRHALLRRIIKAAEIDTVIDTRLVVDPLAASPKAASEINVSGTHGILEACSAPGSPVRKLVLKSSAHWYGCEPDDPAFFSEGMDRRHRPRTSIERDVVAAEEATASFATRNQATTVTVLRFASAIGADLRTSEQALLGMPAVPAVLGFDPRCQFIHEDDVVGALAHATRQRLAGSYNAAADGVLALSEVVSLLGKPLLPVLPPWGTALAADQLRRLGFRIPVELLRGLRYGRGLDNRRLKASGYAFRYTTREAILKLRAQQRLRPLLRGGPEPFRYEPDLEEFLRWSPSVRAASRGPARGGDELADSGGRVDVVGPPVPSYDDLSAEEVIGIAASLEPSALAELRRYEVAHRSRTAVLAALDRNLAGKRD
jgi:UDP-glucose 4-epimerase